MEWFDRYFAVQIRYVSSILLEKYITELLGLKQPVSLIFSLIIFYSVFPLFPFLGTSLYCKLISVSVIALVLLFCYMYFYVAQNPVTQSPYTLLLVISFVLIINFHLFFSMAFTLLLLYSQVVNSAVVDLILHLPFAPRSSLAFSISAFLCIFSNFSAFHVSLPFFLFSISFSLFTIIGFFVLFLTSVNVKFPLVFFPLPLFLLHPIVLISLLLSEAQDSSAGYSGGLTERRFKIFILT